MAKFDLSPKKALILYITITIIVFAQAVWWVTFMALLVGEKVDMAKELGASQNYIAHVHAQEISRQIMVGLEGVFFLLLVGFGIWLIYRTLVKSEELKFHQQNFLMAVTHELKTPLASIKIYLDTLISPKISEDQKKLILPRMKEDANRLEKLVEKILEAGKFERSGYHLNKEIIDFSRLVEQNLDKLKHYPSQTPLEINKITFQPNIHFYGDTNALNRSIEAILENCLKYNDKEIIKLTVELYKKDNYIFLNIGDNGIGLTSKDTSQIFNRFYRGSQEINRSNPGSGLGLYLCREIIKAHDGVIAVFSKGVGKGVKFKIKLKENNQDENNIVS